MAEIAGYRIYYGNSQGQYPNVIEISDAYDNDLQLGEHELPTGTYYVVVTTVDVTGRESKFSEESVFTI